MFTRSECVCLFVCLFVLYLTDECKWVLTSAKVANMFTTRHGFMIRKCTSEQMSQVALWPRFLSSSGIYFDAMEITPPAVGTYRLNKEDQTVRIVCMEPTTVLVKSLFAHLKTTAGPKCSPDKENQLSVIHK